jgi:type 1 glutamine amidotransferase
MIHPATHVESHRRPCRRRIVIKIMKKLIVCLLAAGLASAALAAPKRVLVVTVTKGFRHDSIPTAERILKELGEKSGDFTVDYARTDDELAAKTSPDGLKQYDGVIFANTTGTLPIPDVNAFIGWVRDGHAFMGMHSAADTFHGANGTVSPYTEMLDAEFRTHEAQVEVECLNDDLQHPATAHLGKSFTVFDEIYQMKNHHREQAHLLLALDKHPNSKDPGYYPISWCRDFGKGRVFYTSLGHREDVWDPDWKDRHNSPEVARAYQQHILGGIRWALGLAAGDGAPQDLTYRVSSAEMNEGFKPLFDGKTMDGWHLRHQDANHSWSVENGMLVNRLPRNKDGERPHGVDLVTDKKYWNFEVRYDYMIPAGSNSGFYLRGRHEIQILDDASSGKPSPGGNGSIYNHTAASRNVSKPPGQWQSVDATMIGDRVTVILNGEKIVDNARVDRATGSELDANVNEPGSFFLQGDHGPVAFRNLRVKELK